MGRTLGGTYTSLTVSCWLVRQWELSQISSDHVEFDLYWVEHFSAINSDNVADHLWHHDTVSQVSLYGGWFLPWLTVLFSFFALIVEPVVSVFDFSGKSSSLSGSEELDDLLSGESVDLLWSVSLEGVLLKSLLFLLNCSHRLWL